MARRILQTVQAHGSAAMARLLGVEQQRNRYRNRDSWTDTDPSVPAAVRPCSEASVTAGVTRFHHYARIRDSHGCRPTSRASSPTRDVCRSPARSSGWLILEFGPDVRKNVKNQEILSI